MLSCPLISGEVNISFLNFIQASRSKSFTIILTVDGNESSCPDDENCMYLLGSCFYTLSAFHPGFSFIFKRLSWLSEGLSNFNPDLSRNELSVGVAHSFPVYSFSYFWKMCISSFVVLFSWYESDWGLVRFQAMSSVVSRTMLFKRFKQDFSRFEILAIDLVSLFQNFLLSTHYNLQI